MKLVYIEWQDAFSNNGWQTKEEIEKWKKGEWIVREVGWLYEETKTQIILVSRYSPPDGLENEQYGLLQKIPKTWIRKRIELTKHIKEKNGNKNLDKTSIKI